MDKIKLITPQTLKNLLDLASAKGEIHTMQDIKDFIDLVPAASQKSLSQQWISTEDELPEYEKPVLAYATVCGGFVTVATLERDWVYKNDQSKDKWWLYMDDEGHQVGKEEVTHWMPLPERPE